MRQVYFFFAWNDPTINNFRKLFNKTIDAHLKKERENKK